MTEIDLSFLKGKNIKSLQIIDLSKEIAPNIVVPGEQGYSDPSTEFKKTSLKSLCDDCSKKHKESYSVVPWVNLGVQDYYITKITMSPHAGTHLDAPIHASGSSKGVNDISMSSLIGYAVKLKLDSAKSTKDIINYIKEKAGIIQRNKAVVIIDGEADFAVGDEIRAEIIRLHPKVVVFGDCVNVDGVDDTIQYCSNGIPMIMDATNLDEVNDGDLIFALPIKIKGSQEAQLEAAPVRLFAMRFDIPDEVGNEDDDI